MVSLMLLTTEPERRMRRRIVLIHAGGRARALAVVGLVRS